MLGLANTLWRDDLNIEEGPYKVLILRDKLIDPARNNRAVKLKLYYPADNNLTNLPVIFWSHGLGGGVDGASFLSRYLASQGFIIIHMQHAGTDTSLWEGKDGHPWDIIRDTHITRDVTINRYKDVPFVLDQLPEWIASKDVIKNKADIKNLGMSGHSFGALTTQVMAGMTFPNEDNVLESFKEDRFKSGILYSPGSIEHLGNFEPEDVYPTMDIPLLHMTGTDDGSPIADLGYEIRLEAYNKSRLADKYLLVTKDGDHMVYNGSRGKLKENPKRDIHEEIVKIVALAFWEATLKNSQAAQNWLDNTGISAYLNGEATFEYKKIS